MKSIRWPIRLAVGVLTVAALVWGVYYFEDPEKIDLDDSVRASAPGKFARLSDGYTHYELGGPESGRRVVLAAGFSVPYYIWDPTFKALTDTGFRVLRYDYYGRGLSDRPDIPYSDEMYVRQLDELLAAAGITAPFDLIGISFGGSFITSFADKHPERVRSLVYFDPSMRRPYGVSMIESIPPLWNYLTAVLDEEYWAASQLGDFLHPEKFSDWPARYREQTKYRGFRRARLSELVTNAQADQSSQLKRVGEHARPVLVIWGKQDKTVYFEDSEWFMKLFPEGRLVAVEGAAHLPQWEQPDVVHSELIEFLQR